MEKQTVRVSIIYNCSLLWKVVSVTQELEEVAANKEGQKTDSKVLITVLVWVVGRRSTCYDTTRQGAVRVGTEGRMGIPSLRRRGQYSTVGLLIPGLLMATLPVVLVPPTMSTLPSGMICIVGTYNGMYRI